MLIDQVQTYHTKIFNIHEFYYVTCTPKEIKKLLKVALISVLSVMYLLSILLPASHATPYCSVTSKLFFYSLLYFPVHYILLKYSCFYIFFHSMFLNFFPMNSFFLLINRLLPNLFTFFLIFIFPYFLLLTIYHFYVMAQTLLTFLSWEKKPTIETS